MMILYELRSYLWYKYDGVRGFPLVAWDVSIMPKDEGGLGMIDFAAQGSQYSGNQVGGQVSRGVTVRA